MPHLKLALIKALIVLVPSYTAAYLTEQMVWVIPTLAAAGFFASTVGMSEDQVSCRTDEGDSDGDAGDVALDGS
ncbi:hypothetical protein HW532_05740 [Kaustia mangrovi]|uniref:Uncharacterized protein n=1 Tax=Kaustia mangrovi TaxID=2593653 RepID=A0A7S8C2R7_9HYPH|nr:hypothetical protein [Kaustia mangrovi]QPC42247.1 hypothetical protein HW532_05740 [Kaustia mangrovi]